MNKKQKKNPQEMTTEEIAQAVFPKKVHEHLKELAHGKEKPSVAKVDSSHK